MDTGFYYGDNIGLNGPTAPIAVASNWAGLITYILSFISMAILLTGFFGWLWSIWKKRNTDKDKIKIKVGLISVVIVIILWLIMRYLISLWGQHM
jgi:heme/copper-type cytochrome/quinol oxidase subunit 2